MAASHNRKLLWLAFSRQPVRAGCFLDFQDYIQYIYNTIHSGPFARNAGARASNSGPYANRKLNVEGNAEEEKAGKTHRERSGDLWYRTPEMKAKFKLTKR